MVQVACITCGTIVNKRPRDVKSSGNFCSRECFYKSGIKRPSRETGKNKTCPVCLSVFYAQKSRADAAVYCSKKCKGVASRLDKKECAFCKSLFKPKTTASGQKYCSKDCFSKSRITRQSVPCGHCGKPILVTQCAKRNVNYCSVGCHNKAQSQKDSYVCLQCGNTFYWSPSRAKQQPKYCGVECRTKSPEWRQHMIQSNLVQQHKKGLNNLELLGQKILQDIGVPFQEQFLMFDKFLVDVFLPDYNIVIQWDGDYWHGYNGAKDERQKNRQKLDKSQDAYMRKSGVKVLRFWEHEVKKEREKVIEAISRAIQ